MLIFVTMLKLQYFVLCVELRKLSSIWGTWHVPQKTKSDKILQYSGKLFSAQRVARTTPVHPHYYFKDRLFTEIYQHYSPQEG